MTLAARARHGWTTRAVHAALALAVATQLGSSLAMRAPRGAEAGNAAFSIHQASGLVAMGLVLSFWAVAMIRVAGTDPGRLFPWFSHDLRADLRRDIARHWAALRNLRFLPYAPDAPLAAAVHGLGLLLVTFMAGSGTAFALAGPDLRAGPALGLLMDAHAAAGNIVWVYLFGHVGMAFFHHLSGGMRLGEMWSLAPRPAGEHRT